MKFFIDTGDTNEIREAVAMGMVDGVTTNPSLIAKANRPFEEVIREITEIVDGPISAEVVSLEAEGMVAEGRKLAAIHANIVVKVPMTIEGLKATKIFAAEGIKTNVTLVFSAGQALLAAKAGATYVSPFIGRLDDVSTDGLGLISEIRLIFDNYGYETEILAASVRHTMHIIDCAKIGADVMTGPLSAISGLLKHPLTDIGLEKFLADFKKGN